MENRSADRQPKSTPRANGLPRGQFESMTSFGEFVPTFRSIASCDQKNSSLGGYWLIFLTGIGGRIRPPGGNIFGFVTFRLRNCSMRRQDFQVLNLWKMLEGL